MLEGLMMDWPLTLTHFLDRGRRIWSGQHIITRTHDGTHRYTFKDWAGRVDRLAHALTRLGIKSGDRVATFGWNSYRHYEVYFAAPCMGAVSPQGERGAFLARFDGSDAGAGHRPVT